MKIFHSFIFTHEFIYYPFWGLLWFFGIFLIRNQRTRILKKNCGRLPKMTCIQKLTIGSVLLTFLKTCRMQSIFPKLCIRTGFWIMIIIVGTMRWISIGYKYQSNASRRSFNSVYALVTCWPNSQTRNVVSIDQIICTTRLITRKPFAAGWD